MEALNDLILSILLRNRESFAVRFPSAGPESTREGSSMTAGTIVEMIGFTSQTIAKRRTAVGAALRALVSTDLVRIATRKGRNNAPMYSATTEEERAARADEERVEARAERLAEALAAAGYRDAWATGGVVSLDAEAAERLFLKAHGVETAPAVPAPAVDVGAMLDAIEASVGELSHGLGALDPVVYSRHTVDSAVSSTRSAVAALRAKIGGAS